MTLNSLQLIQNASVWVLMRSSSRNQISTIAASLHWLPVKFRMEFLPLLLIEKAPAVLAPFPEVKSSSSAPLWWNHNQLASRKQTPSLPLKFLWKLFFLMKMKAKGHYTRSGRFWRRLFLWTNVTQSWIIHELQWIGLSWKTNWSYLDYIQHGKFCKCSLCKWRYAENVSWTEYCWPTEQSDVKSFELIEKCKAKSRHFQDTEKTFTMTGRVFSVFVWATTGRPYLHW